MQSQASAAGSGRFIVRSESPVHLLRFIESVRLDPGITLVDIIGPAGQPHTVVLTMSAETARLLDLQFRTTNALLTIEPDRPLSLFGETCGPA